MIATRLYHLFALAACSTFVCLIDNHNIPGDLLQTTYNTILLRKIYRGNTLSVTITYITPHRSIHLLKRLIKLVIDLILTMTNRRSCSKYKSVIESTTHRKCLEKGATNNRMA